MKICFKAARQPLSERVTTTIATAFGSKTLQWVPYITLCSLHTLPMLLSYLALLTITFPTSLPIFLILSNLTYLPFLILLYDLCLIFLLLTCFP